MIVSVYWRKIDSVFADTVEQIEHEDGHISENDESWRRLIGEEWEKVSLDQDRLFHEILSRPIGQSLFLLKKLKDGGSLILLEMAKDPKAALCTGRIHRVINRRWLILVFDEASMEAFVGKEILK